MKIIIHRDTGCLNLIMILVLHMLKYFVCVIQAYCGKHSKKKDGDVLTPPSTPRKEAEMTEQEKNELRSHR